MNTSRHLNGRTLLATVVILLLSASLNPSFAQSDDCWKCESPAPPVSRSSRASGSSKPSPVNKQQRRPSTRPENRNASFVKALELGDAAYTATRYTQAEAHYRRAQGLFPANPRPYIGLGNIYYVREQYGPAASAYKKVFELERDAQSRDKTFRMDYKLIYEVAFYLGNSYFNQRRYEEAANTYQLLTKLNPGDYWLFYNLGRAYFYQRRYAESVQPFSQLVQLLPNDHLSHYWLGGAYYYTGQHSEAIKECKRSIGVNPNFSSGYYCMGLAYVAKNKKSDAMKQYRILLNLNRKLADELLTYINR
jgi:tetratricopeptide (TPR) repeat protein